MVTSLFNGTEKFSDILWDNGPWQEFRNTQFDFSFEDTSVNDILIDKIPYESPQLMKSCSDRCDFESSVLLVFDKGLDITTDYILQMALPNAGIENEKRNHSDKAPLKSAWLVVHSPLVAYVALEVILGGKIQYEDLFKNTIDRRLCYFRRVSCAVKIYCCDFTDDCSENCTCLGHCSSSFSLKKQD